MRYFTPRLQIASLAGEQTKLLSKIGGVPWGLPPEKWPVCCGQPEKLLAQLCHEPPMLDLGAPGAVLHLFQCLECLGIGEFGRDAFVLDQSEFRGGLVRIPKYDHSPDLGARLIGEFWITGWKEEDDGIPTARFSEFFDERKLWKLQEEFPKIEWFDCRMNTKFGGSPRWTGNGPMGFPPSPFEYLFQLDNYLYLEGPPPSPNDAGCGVTTFGDKGRVLDTSSPDSDRRRINAPWLIMHDQSADCHYAEYTNLGSDGTAYVFVDRNRLPHEVQWFWNR